MPHSKGGLFAFVLASVVLTGVGLIFWSRVRRQVPVVDKVLG